MGSDDDITPTLPSCVPFRASPTASRQVIRYLICHDIRPCALCRQPNWSLARRKPVGIILASRMFNSYMARCTPVVSFQLSVSQLMGQFPSPAAPRRTRRCQTDALCKIRVILGYFGKTPGRSNSDRPPKRVKARTSVEKITAHPMPGEPRPQYYAQPHHVG